jgi:cobalt-zinc-cadmium resistance protein CzcA
VPGSWSAERLSAAASLIPNGYGTPELGPLTTALGEILQFEVRGEKYSPTQLRTMLEWDVAPRLREVPGVTEINTHGGYYKAWGDPAGSGTAEFVFFNL